MDNYHRHLNLLHFNGSASVVVGGDVAFCFCLTHLEWWRFLCQSSFDLSKKALKFTIAIVYGVLGGGLEGWRVTGFGHWPVTYN